MNNINNYKKEKEFLAAIDSDGCALNTMEIKHKECFVPQTIKFWNLEEIPGIVKETWEYVNLYSKSRGSNRFEALIIFFNLLNERKEIVEKSIEIPDLTPLSNWIKSEDKLSNKSLEEYYKKNGDLILKRVLEWSHLISEEIKKVHHKITPFINVKEALERLAERADIIVISQSSIDAIKKDWEDSGLLSYTKLLTGREDGSKENILQKLITEKYEKNKSIMIGDSEGDLEAAIKNKILFYPIFPQSEKESWEKFINAGIDNFFKVNYEGKYQNELIEKYKKLLLDKPWWNK